MADPISDMLNRIRNAQAVLKETVDIPFSNLKYEISKILEKENFIEKAEKKGKKSKKLIKISLKYLPSKAGEKGKGGEKTKIAAISGLKRISKSGQRIYLSVKKIQKKGRVRGGYGIAIISTPKGGGGLMTDKKARLKKVGGEILCEIW